MTAPITPERLPPSREERALGSSVAEISVIIPAHNESAVVGRLLRALVADAAPGELQVIVVANGCTDDTAAVAAIGDPVTVVETPVPSKYKALRLGEQHATGRLRFYVDADVVLTTASARALARALDDPGVLAAAPRRDLALAGSPLAVRWYYDVWQRLPAVADGLFGRGVICVGEQGHDLFSTLPDVIGDDLSASLAFPPDKRVLVPDASVVIYPPRTMGDLIRRRVRTATGLAQARDTMPAARGEQTSVGSLVRLVRRHPLLAPKVAVFLGVALVARSRARRHIRSGDFQTWLRDESSRSPS